MRISSSSLALVLVCSIAAPGAAQNLRSVPVAAFDLAFSPLTNRVYASVPTGNSIVEIDPVAGTLTGVSLIVGSQPRRLAISDTGEYLYVALGGAPRVKRVHLPTMTIDLDFPLGQDSSGPFYARDLEVMPGAPDVLAVTLSNQFSSFPQAAIFDRGVPRPVMSERFDSIGVIEFASPTRLYGYNNDTSEFGFRRLIVDAAGVTILDATEGLIVNFNADFAYDSGRVYSTNGRIVDPEGLALLGTFLEASQGFQNVVEPHAVRGVVFYVTRDFSPVRLTLRTFSIQTELQIDELPLNGITGDPTSLITWGTHGLAFAVTSGAVWLVDNGLMPPDAPSIAITSPTTEPTFDRTAGTMTLGGTATDPGGAAVSITWSSDRGGSGTIAGSAAWQIGAIPVRPGVNTITVSMLGSTGRTATDSITVTGSAPTYVLAEGATGSFFDLDLSLANPNGVAVPVDIEYLLEGGTTIPQTLTLAPTSRTTIRVDEVPGLENVAVSTVVRSVSGHPLVVERTMRWGGQYGSHTDKATEGLSPTWYFAEGSQGFFQTYLLLANPNGVANTATVDWLREGEAPLRRTYSLPPNSRTTVFAGDDPELVNRSFGITVTFDVPAVADRTMYFGLPPDTLFKGGHNSAGVTAPATSWLLAEGATGSFFDTFILIANPNDAAVTATLTFLPQDGAPVVRTVIVSARGRTTVNIEALSPAAPSLSNAAVATQVVASAPVVVERAQYWPGLPPQWYGTHNSFGVPAAAPRWGLAEGRVGNPPGLPALSYQTYVLLANPGTADAQATVTVLRENGTPVQKSFFVGRQTRRTIQIAGPGSDVPELNHETFGVVIDATQPIAVERAMYGTVAGQVFGTGSNATATPLP